MNCELCGKEGGLVVAIVENVEMKVCGGCSKFGKVIRRNIPAPVKKKETKKNEVTEDPVDEEVIVSDFAKKIRRAREKLKMEQKDFAKFISEKESIVHKMEIGEHKPSLKVAKKLQKMLKIRLIDVYKEEKKSYETSKSEGFTLGDFIKKG